MLHCALPDLCCTMFLSSGVWNCRSLCSSTSLGHRAREACALCTVLVPAGSFAKEPRSSQRELFMCHVIEPNLMSFWNPSKYSGQHFLLSFSCTLAFFFSHIAGESNKFLGSFRFQFFPCFPWGVWSQSLLSKWKIFFLFKVKMFGENFHFQTRCL